MLNIKLNNSIPANELLVFQEALTEDGMIDIKKLPTGIYMIFIKISDAVWTDKILRIK